jgi:hypothetical protein
MSNTRKLKPRNHRLIEMALIRKQKRLRVKIDQENARQRAEHARKFSAKKMVEIHNRLIEENTPAEVIFMETANPDDRQIIIIDPLCLIDPDDGYRPDTQVTTERDFGNR